MRTYTVGRSAPLIHSRFPVTDLYITYIVLLCQVNRIEAIAAPSRVYEPTFRANVLSGYPGSQRRVGRVRRCLPDILRPFAVQSLEELQYFDGILVIPPAKKPKQQPRKHIFHPANISHLDR